MSCTAADLMEAQNKVRDEFLDDPAKVIMLVLKDNSAGK